MTDNRLQEREHFMKPQLDGQPARLLSSGQKEAFPEHFNLYTGTKKSRTTDSLTVAVRKEALRELSVFLFFFAGR